MFPSWSGSSSASYPSSGRYSSALAALPGSGGSSATEVTGMLSGFPLRNAPDAVKTLLGKDGCGQQGGAGALLADLTATKPIGNLVAGNLRGQGNGNDRIGAMMSMGAGMMFQTVGVGSGVRQLLQMATGAGSLTDARSMVGLANDLLGLSKGSMATFSGAIEAASLGQIGLDANINPGLLLSGAFDGVGSSIKGIPNALSDSTVALKGQLAGVGVTVPMMPNITLTQLKGAFPGGGAAGDAAETPGALASMFEDVKKSASEAIQQAYDKIEKKNPKKTAGKAVVGGAPRSEPRPEWIRLIDGEGEWYSVSGSSSTQPDFEPSIYDGPLGTGEDKLSLMEKLGKLMDSFSLEGLLDSLRGMFAKLKGMIEAGIQGILDFVKGLLKGLMGIICGFFAAVGSALGAIGRAIDGAIGSATGGFMDALGKVGGAIGNALKSAYNFITDLIGKITCMIGYLLGFLGDILGMIGSLLGTVLKGLADLLAMIPGLLTCGDESKPSGGMCSPKPAGGNCT